MRVNKRFEKMITVGLSLIIITGATTLFAGTPAKSDSTVAALNKDNNRPWTLGLPLWIPGFTGKFAVGGIEVEGEPEDDNIFDQIFSSEYGLDFYFVGLVNYRLERWRFHADVFGGSIGKSAKFIVNDKSVLGAKIEMIMPRIYASYDLLHQSPLGPINHWQVYMGGRLYFLNLEVTLGENSEKKEGSSNWFTFLVGTELSVKIAKRWHLLVSGDIGGLLATKKLTIFAQTTLNYRPWDLFSVNLGLAFMHMEESGDNSRDVELKANLFGPTLGLAFHF